MESLPVIDAALLPGGPQPAGDPRVGALLREVCERHGFFYLRNHDIDPPLIDEVFAQTARLFALPLADKLALDRAHSRCNRGYEPLRAQTLQSGAPPDLKEGFYLGTDLPPDDPRVLAGRFNQGPNQWPSGLPGFRETMQRYFDQCYRLAGRVVRGLALSLDLPVGFFDAYLTDASATLRLLHYPPQPARPAPGEKGCGEHTDFGGVTLLLQDDCGGLQVRDPASGGWIDAPPQPGCFVVNLGDLFARWTNDRYQSTLHRVVNLSGRERYSVPFFFTGNPDHRVQCLPTCLAAGEAPRHPTVTVEQHLRACYQRTYA
ncbi:MAG TPA: 2-oxoglutarate and iron-dependent oxygenase domain-containing protein [Burkholderiaceae bacterium]|nr:2-oxoglutarate and iron-dependent oxygenase domain-containing protein [Burkholderiaceae bacterium]